jgi:heme-degrading monooxygenase HmoA
MHTRVARYGYTGDPHDLARRAEEGMLPAFQSQPGFKGYTLVETGGEVISITSWDSAESAEQASSLAVEWIAENMAGEIELTDVATGEILFSTVLGVTSKTTT